MGAHALLLGHEDEARRVVIGDSAPRVGEESGLLVAGIQLHFVGIAAGDEDVSAVRRDGEVAGMGSSGLIGYFLHGSIVEDADDGEAIALQSVARIEELAVG